MLGFVAATGGLIIGSFLNVVAYRLPAGQSLATPASRCPGCETPIRPYDNIPVLSWLLLRGAEVALEKLGGDVSAGDKAFYEGKVAAASFFAKNVLPHLASERAIAESIDDSVMELDEAAF